MNKAALYASIAMLPVLAFAPLTGATDDAPPAANAKNLDKPLQKGDKMPNFSITDAAYTDQQIELDALLEDGPVVVTFYRGSWCPYCIGELTSIQSRLSQITDTGATVLAISPEKPADTADLTEQKELGFLFGADHDNALAKSLALAFTLDKNTIEKYKKYGIDLPESNDSDAWELPIPATYVINTDHTIAYAFVEEDYRQRADYNEVVKVLKKMQKDN